MERQRCFGKLCAGCRLGGWGGHCFLPARGLALGFQPAPSTTGGWFGIRGENLSQLVSLLPRLCLVLGKVPPTLSDCVSLSLGTQPAGIAARGPEASPGAHLSKWGSTQVAARPGSWCAPCLLHPAPARQPGPSNAPKPFPGSVSSTALFLPPSSVHQSMRRQGAKVPPLRNLLEQLTRRRRGALAVCLHPPLPSSCNRAPRLRPITSHHLCCYETVCSSKAALMSHSSMSPAGGPGPGKRAAQIKVSSSPGRRSGCSLGSLVCVLTARPPGQTAALEGPLPLGSLFF